MQSAAKARHGLAPRRSAKGKARQSKARERHAKHRKGKAGQGHAQHSKRLSDAKRSKAWQRRSKAKPIFHIGKHAPGLYARMMRWQEIKTPEEWLAIPESEKREIAREILESAFGPPVNQQRQNTIEAVLNGMFGPETKHETETLDPG